MLLAFVDESYCDDWFFMVAALAHSQRQADRLDRMFGNLLRTESERLAIPRAAEVHGYDLFQGAGPWGAVKLHERIAIAAKIINLMAEADIRFVIRGLDRVAQQQKYRDPYPPYPMILTHITRAINDIAGERKTKARVVCDEIHQHDRHRAMIERYRDRGTPGYAKSKLERIDGQLTFVESHASSLIQAADLVAYLRHRIASRPDVGYQERRARNHLWGKIERLTVHDYCWRP